MREHLIKEAGKEGCERGDHGGEKEVLQDPSLVHKSQRHGRFSPEQRHRGPFTKARERESRIKEREERGEMRGRAIKPEGGKEAAQSRARPERAHTLGSGSPLGVAPKAGCQAVSHPDCAEV